MTPASIESFIIGCGAGWFAGVVSSVIVLSLCFAASRSDQKLGIKDADH